MKRCLPELVRRSLALGLQLLAVAPLFLLAGCGVAEPARRWALLLALCASALSLAAGFAPSRARKWLFPALAALAGAGAMLLPAMPDQMALHMLYAALCAALVVLLSIVQQRGVSALRMASGVPVHLFAAALVNLDACEPARPYLLPAACLYLVALVFHLNADAFGDQFAVHAQRPSLRMRLGNAAMSAAFLALVFVAYQFDRLRQLTGEAVRRLILLIFYLISLIVPSPVAEDGGGGAQPGMLGMPPAEEPSLLWVILERVFLVLAAVAAAYLLALGLRKLWRGARVLLTKLRALVAKYLGAVGADYVDEVEVISGWAELRQSVDVRIRRALGGLTVGRAWRDMDNRQRIRAAYRQLSQRSGAPSHMTAGEVLSTAQVRSADPALLRASYDRARYSDHPIGDAEAENARKAL